MINRGSAMQDEVFEESQPPIPKPAIVRHAGGFRWRCLFCGLTYYNYVNYEDHYKETHQ